MCSSSALLLNMGRVDLEVSSWEAILFLETATGISLSVFDFFFLVINHIPRWIFIIYYKVKKKKTSRKQYSDTHSLLESKVSGSIFKMQLILEQREPNP